MKVGFTGTRAGMSDAQDGQLQYVLALFKHADKAVGRKSEFHYGVHEDVVLEADSRAAELANVAGFHLVSHFARRGEELARDRDIAAAVHVLIAAPLTDKEQLRSGTWATVRYTRALLKPVVMLSRGKP